MPRTRRRPRPRRPPAQTRRQLDQLQQVRVLAHPLRLRLLEAFALGPCTTKQAAERLGEPPTRLYHHVYAMERAGILRLRETRPNRGTIEKYFEPVAHRFEADPSLFARTRATGAIHPAVAIAHAAIDELRRDLGPGLAAADRLPEGLKPILMRMVIHGDAARIRALREEVAALIRRRQACGPEAKPGRGPVGSSPRGRGGRAPGARLRYTLTIALLPAAPPARARVGATAGARRGAGTARR